MLETATVSDRVLKTLRPIPDYPKPGILFQDITPVLRDGGLLRDVVLEMCRPFLQANVTHVLGIEARGFILGGAVATTLGAGFVPARKPGKLPWERASEAYELEYGSDSLEAHRDAWTKGSRVLVVDDNRRHGPSGGAVGSRSSGGAGGVELLAGNRRIKGTETIGRNVVSGGGAGLRWHVSSRPHSRLSEGHTLH
jgi:adenine phosphoribosyltransferase